MIGAPPMSGGGSWSGRNIARDFKVCPTDDSQGYLLDGLDGIHPVGNAVQPTQYAYFSFDIARSIVILPDCQSGYTLDGYGGIHPFAGGSASLPPNATNYAYFPGNDIARGMVLENPNPSSPPNGYTLDGYGGVHVMGSAPVISPQPSFGFDIARGMVLTVDNPCCSGYVLDGYGGVHRMGPNAFDATTSNSWPNLDLGRGISMNGAWLNRQQPYAPYWYQACGYYADLYGGANQYSENGASC